VICNKKKKIKKIARPFCLAKHLNCLVSDKWHIYSFLLIYLLISCYGYTVKTNQWYMVILLLGKAIITELTILNLFTLRHLTKRAKPGFSASMKVIIWFYTTVLHSYMHKVWNWILLIDQSWKWQLTVFETVFATSNIIIRPVRTSVQSALILHYN
jgi:hypothetical protein